MRFFAADRVPMGGRTQATSPSVTASIWLADPDYSGPYNVRLFHGTQGGKVEVVTELTGVSVGRHALSLELAQPGEHFFYVEVLELDANRATWSAPIWIESRSRVRRRRSALELTRGRRAAVVWSMSKLISRAVAISVALSVTVAGCGKRGPFTAPLSIKLEANAAKATIGPEGGSIQVKSATGTSYVLQVPPGALIRPVEITATPVASFDRAGSARQGVVFKPSGLQFLAPATLTMTPSKPIPVPRQLVFTFNDDGSELWAAEPMPKTGDIAVVVQHFSGFGFADLGDKAREVYVHWKTSRAETRIQNEVGEALAAEKRRQLLGDESGSGAAARALSEGLDQYEKDVVNPRIAAAGTSCAAATEAAATGLALARQRALLGMKDKDTTVPLVQLIQLPFGPCEKEAIAACKAAKDPGILIKHWLGADKVMAVLGGAQPYATDGMLERAQAICDPQAYQVVGGLQDWKVNQKVCNIQGPFVLSTGVGTMKLSGGMSGTYSFGGVFASQYTGKYTITFPDGPRKPGKMVGSGGGSIAGQKGAGTETYTLTPIGPAC